MDLANKDIRQAIADSGVKKWQIAEKMNVSDGTFSRWLRSPFSKGKREEVFKIIRELRG